MHSSNLDISTARRVAIASAFGSVLEWYDFFLFSTVAGIVFNKLFFPSVVPLIGTVLAFTTFAAGFVVRPIGGIFFGHLGDRVGRKQAFVLTLLIMGIATFLIGLLPTYASAGIWGAAALLILRVVQGFALGGEWGGAALMAVEYAPKDRPGFYGSWPQAGVPLGLLLAAIVVALLSMVPDDAFLAWGWRVAFLVSGLLVAMGLYIRLRISETPLFEECRRSQREAKVPFVELWRTQALTTILAMGCRFAEGVTFTLFGVYAVVYLRRISGPAQTTFLIAISVLALIMVFLIPVFGEMSDRYGRRRVFSIGVLGIALLAYPTVWLLNTQELGPVLLGIAVAFGVVYPMMCAPIAALLSESFSTRVRYTGVSFAYQFSGIFAGLLAPSIAPTLPRLDGGHGWMWVFAGYMGAAAVVSLVSVAWLGKRTRKDLAEL